MNRLIKGLIPTAFVLTTFSSCFTDNSESLYPAGTACNTDSVTYSAVVKPIFTQNCALSGCHNTASAMNGVILDTYTGAKAIADNGKLVGVITHAQGFTHMPKDRPKMDDCTIAQITKWVNNGAPNN